MNYLLHPNPRQRDVQEIRSIHGHSPYAQLRVVADLRKVVDQQELRRDWLKGKVNRQAWYSIIGNGIDEWLANESIRLGDDENGPVVPTHNAAALVCLYMFFNAKFFDNSLPPILPRSIQQAKSFNNLIDGINYGLGIRTFDCRTNETVQTYGSSSSSNRPPSGIEIDWADSLEDDALGRTSFTTLDDIEISILRKSNGKEYVSGADAMEVLSTLLHEMCHVFDVIHLCHCQDCNPGGIHGIQTSCTGHSNSFFYLACLVERAANQTFGFLGRFDLNLTSTWEYEDCRWQESLNNGHQG